MPWDAEPLRDASDKDLRLVREGTGVSYRVMLTVVPNGPGEASPPRIEADNIQSVIEAIELASKWRKERYCNGRGPESFNEFRVETHDGQPVYEARGF